MVRTGRLELPHRKILEPKSSASTNSATSASDVHYTSPKARVVNAKANQGFPIGPLPTLS